MTDLIDDLRDWYAHLPDDTDATAMVAAAVPAGSNRRRRRRGLVATAVVLVAATIGFTAVASTRSTSRRVDVITPPPTTARPAVPVATAREFPDIERLRAWLVQTIGQSAAQPALVRAQIARTASL